MRLPMTVPTFPASDGGPHLQCLPVFLPTVGPPLTWLTSTTWISRAAMSSIRFCGSSSRRGGAPHAGRCSLQQPLRPRRLAEHVG